MTDRRELFSPIPKHVMGDQRLTAGHHRVLLAIAWHSRFDDNGRGCYAKHSVLADEADISYENVSRFTADLEAWGIITSERFALDRRLRIYRLIFKEKKAIGVELNKEYETPDESTEKSAIGVGLNNYQPEIVVGQKEEVTDSQQERASQYILLNSRGIYDVETSLGRNTNLPAENNVDRNPKTRWENLVPLKTKAST